jgi:hypothetical protein
MLFNRVNGKSYLISKIRNIFLRQMQKGGRLMRTLFLISLTLSSSQSRQGYCVIKLPIRHIK